MMLAAQGAAMSIIGRNGGRDMFAKTAPAWNPDLTAAPESPLTPGELEARARLRARPDFPEIARRAAVNLGRSYQGNVLLTRLLNDRARIALALLMLDMHFEPAEAPGLTAGRLKAEAVALGLCSPGRVGAVLAAARLLGLVAPAPDKDGRRRRLVATPRLLDIHRERWRVLFEAMHPALPEGGIGLSRLDDPGFGAAYVSALLRPFRAGWRIAHDIPRVDVFADRDGGLMIAFALYEATRAGETLTILHLAQTYRVSRSHVGDILRKAAEAGLVRRVEAPGTGSAGFVAEPALDEAIDTFVAIALVRQAFAIREAVAATSAGPR